MSEKSGGEQPPRNETIWVSFSDGYAIGLHDPLIAEYIDSEAKRRCDNLFMGFSEDIQRYKARFDERGFDPQEVVMVFINVDDDFGAPLADIIMPDHDWQQYRDAGQKPFAQGLTSKPGVMSYLNSINPEMGEELGRAEDLAVVVMDYGIARVYVPSGHQL